MTQQGDLGQAKYEPRDGGVALGVVSASVQHRVRHAFPLRAAMQRSLARMEGATAEEIRRYRERRLRALVRLAAARSPFYRE